MDTSNTHRGDVTCTAVSLEQQLIITGAADKTVRVWDMSTGKVMAVLKLIIPCLRTKGVRLL